MTETLERPRRTSELEDDFRLDLGKIDISEHLSETSSFKLRAAPPTAERPVAIYVAAPEKANEDLMTESLFAVQENRKAFWRISDSPESVGIVRGYADGDLEELGVGDSASISGNFTIERGEKIYMIPNQLIEALKNDDRFNIKGINFALSNAEGVEISFDSAVTAVSPDVSAKPISDKKAGFARRMRNRPEQPQNSTEQNIEMPNAVAMPTPVDVARSAEAHRVRAEKAAELVQRMNTGATTTERVAQPAASRLEHTNDADTINSLRGFAQRKKARETRMSDMVTIPESAGDDIVSAEAGYTMTDNRKWSRVEMLGHEVGIHSDVSITVPVPETKPNASTTEIGIQAFFANEMAKEMTLVTPKNSAVPFEVANYNPNNDPAIEYGFARLGALRDEMASLTATKQNQLLSINGKKTREIANAYAAQLVALGHLVTADKMFEHMLTDSQKSLAGDSRNSIAVTKYIINEQAALQAATKKKLKGTKAGKFAEWMNIHGINNDYFLDAGTVMQVIDHDLPGDDKMRLASEHMADLHKKHVRAEQHERRKGALRMAVGVVGTAAAALGVNPSAARRRGQ